MKHQSNKKEKESTEISRVSEREIEEPKETCRGMDEQRE